MAAEPQRLVDVVRLSAGWLGDHGSDSPRLDAELLAAHALGLRRIDLYLQFDRPLDAGELGRIRELVRRRGGGEPVAYILGRREFYGRSFAVSPAVLVPRPETETLVEEALRAARAAGESGIAADLGTGSGCIACTLAAELPGWRVIGVDVSPDALAVAGANAESLGVAGRVDLRQGSWAEPLTEPVDVLVANPPYITESELGGLARDVAEHEPKVALVAGGDGLAAYRDLLASLAAPPGWFGFEVDPRRATGVAELVAARWPGTEPRVVDDLAGRARVVTGRPGGAEAR